MYDSAYYLPMLFEKSSPLYKITHQLSFNKTQTQKWTIIQETSGSSPALNDFDLSKAQT